MKGAPVCEQFDDIYFSAEDGLAETAHVFLQGNDLPHVWQDKARFVIAETGFGTGLNFLSAWKLFEETAKNTQTLDFISFEKYPLTPSAIKDALAPWADFFGTRIDKMLEKYPLRVAGFHRVKINAQITLTLMFDDVNDALPEVEAYVDCWFLDGFTPAKNPDMWSADVFEHMARLSHAGTTYATFTAAGDVRRGLKAAGFSVEKCDGFGRKRDMIKGRFETGKTQNIQALRHGGRIAIIGGGLAGTSMAHTLKQYGFEPVIYEANNRLAPDASGNDVGMYNPRFAAQRDAMTDFFSAAYVQLINVVKQVGEGVRYTPCGALHLMNTPEKKKRFASMVKAWGWKKDLLQIVDAQQASELAGIEINHDALYLPDAGSVSPEKLCHYYAADVETHLNTKIDKLEEMEADAIILCNAHAAQNYDCLSWLPLTKVRGQISEISASSVSRNIKCNIHYGGYISASKTGGHTLGATFDKWLTHTDVLEEGHQYNIQTLQDNIDVLEDEKFEVVSGRASLRCASKDHFPVVGAVPETNNIYVSTAFGSHGLVGSIMGAHIIADYLRAGPRCLTAKTQYALSPQRFIDREKRKQQ